ncbi:MAG: ribonuclease H-like domain-containing protein [Nitrospirae bacterium]|nr:ribonuclease H-like domain-containing protein [Nitrospirota bacterium]MBI3393636.1 ribonuclease H-like domain-containing protein [Nitrospirota bacterium]
MLERTFIHVPRIGEKREAALWVRGYTSWDRFREAYPPGAFREHALGYLDRDLAARSLPRAHAWRLFPEFAGCVLYLDIETTGLYAGPNSVTCIGTYDGRTVRAFVAGADIDEFEHTLNRAELLVTYNGACFDIPFLKTAFPRLDFDRPAHIDLMYPLRKLGFRGGLKGVERQLCIRRDEAIAGADGYTAVLLWHAHERGCPSALETLVRYCLEDVVNLEPLMIEVFNRFVETYPLDIRRLPIPPRPKIAARADADLVRRLTARPLPAP